MRTIPSWTGVTSSNGRWGLSAPSKGGEHNYENIRVLDAAVKGENWIQIFFLLGLDLLDMRLDGEAVRTFLPRTALGIFTVKAMFTQVMGDTVNQKIKLKYTFMF